MNPAAPYLEKVGSSRGAPMGRPTFPNEHYSKPSFDADIEESPLYLRRVPFVDGCYDPGGAYWGGPSNLFCAWNHARTYWTRAASRDQAKQQIRKDHPDAPGFKR